MSLEAWELAKRHNPDAVREVRLLREKYGDVPLPSSDDPQVLALRIRDELEFLGAKDRTSKAIAAGIAAGEIPISSFMQLADMNVGDLIKIPGVGPKTLTDLSTVLWRTEAVGGKVEPTQKPQVVVAKTPDEVIKYADFRERLAAKEAVIAQLADLNLPTGFNALKRAIISLGLEVYSLEALMQMSNEELLAIKNFGQKSLDELRNATNPKTSEED